MNSTTIGSHVIQDSRWLTTLGDETRRRRYIHRRFNAQQIGLGPASKLTNFATVSTMASMGHIEEFEPGHADWQQWHERLLFYLDANNIDVPEKQRSVFF